MTMNQASVVCMCFDYPLNLISRNIIVFADGSRYTKAANGQAAGKIESGQNLRRILLKKELSFYPLTTVAVPSVQL